MDPLLISVVTEGGVEVSSLVPMVDVLGSAGLLCAFCCDMLLTSLAEEVKTGEAKPVVTSVGTLSLEIVTDELATGESVLELKPPLEKPSFMLEMELGVTPLDKTVLDKIVVVLSTEIDASVEPILDGSGSTIVL